MKLTEQFKFKILNANYNLKFKGQFKLESKRDTTILNSKEHLNSKLKWKLQFEFKRETNIRT